MRTNRYQLKASTTILLSTLFNLHIMCIYSLLSVSSVLVLIPSHSDLESIQGCHLIWWEKHSAMCCYPCRFELEPRSWIYMGFFFFPFHIYFFFPHLPFSLFSLKHLKMSVRRRIEKWVQNVFYITHLKTGRKMYSLALKLLDWDIFMKSKRSHSPDKSPSPVFQRV